MLDIVLGIVGAIVGGFLFSLFGQQGRQRSKYLQHV
jgi:uncharacterized membrane protein YeaQ/YmgE (transglycosylase-associated protein family)